MAKTKYPFPDKVDSRFVHASSTNTVWAGTPMPMGVGCQCPKSKGGNIERLTCTDKCRTYLGLSQTDRVLCGHEDAAGNLADWERKNPPIEQRQASLF